MATKTVTVNKVSSVELHISVEAAYKRYSPRDGQTEIVNDSWHSCRTEILTANSKDAQPDESRHNAGTTGSASSAASGATQPAFEGDIISPAYFRRMAPAPWLARRRLLLAVEPRCMAPRRQWVRTGRDSNADPPVPVTTDFCIPFDRNLLRKLRANRHLLQKIADRTCSLIYIRKTLLIRGVYRTKTWAKYFMCRFYSLKQPLLNRCFRLLEQFDKAFCARHGCQQERARVTLLPNRTVPDNTALGLTRQRLRKSDDYFGKMPLLPDPHLANLAARLTKSCVNSSSLLAQLVAVEP